MIRLVDWRDVPRPFVVQAEQSWLVSQLDDMDAAFAASDPCRAALGHDGQVLGVGGLLPQWPGRATAWALFAPEIGGLAMLAIVRALKEGISASSYRRIDFTVRVGFDAGHRLAELLGFRLEALLYNWGPDGRDYLQYVRIRP